MIKDIFCKSDYEIMTASIDYDINKSSESLDWVVGSISFKSP